MKLLFAWCVKMHWENIHREKVDRESNAKSDETHD